jgi:hypothetical protein
LALVIQVFAALAETVGLRTARVHPRRVRTAAMSTSAPFSTNSVGTIVPPRSSIQRRYTLSRFHRSTGVGFATGTPARSRVVNQCRNSSPCR